MKKLLFLSFLLTALVKLSAQRTFNKAYHEVNEQTNPFLVAIAGDIYFTTQSWDVIPFGQCYLYKHSANGTLKFKSAVIGGYTPTHGYKSFDDKLIVVGQISICDVALPNMPNFITKLDTNGTVIFTSTYSAVFQDVPKASLQYSDSSYFTFTDSLLIKHSKTGQFISKTNLGLNGISSAILLQNNTILLSAQQASANSIVVISSNGAVLTSTVFPSLLTKMVFYGGQKIMGLGTDGKLYKISATLNMVASSSFSVGLIVSDFICYNDSVYSILSSTVSSEHYAISDTMFNIASLTSTTTHYLNQNAITINVDQTVILSTSKSKNSYSFPEHYFASLNVIDRHSSNNFGSDVALISVMADSTFMPCTPIVLTGGNLCTSYFKVKAKIKNMGNSPVTSFKLNCFSYPSVACGGYFYQHKFTGFSLAPGDTLTVSTDFVPKSLGQVLGTIINVEYCFYTTIPNGETDKTFEDNELCISQVFVPTSVKEYSAVDLNVSVFPNPFQNNLSVTSESTIKTIEVINALGMTVCKNAVGDTKITLSHEELSSGIYFIKIETEKGSVTKKIIRQ